MQTMNGTTALVSNNRVAQRSSRQFVRIGRIASAKSKGFRVNYAALLVGVALCGWMGDADAESATCTTSGATYIGNPSYDGKQQYNIEMFLTDHGGSSQSSITLSYGNADQGVPECGGFSPSGGDFYLTAPTPTDAATLLGLGRRGTSTSGDAGAQPLWAQAPNMNITYTLSETIKVLTSPGAFNSKSYGARNEPYRGTAGSYDTWTDYTIAKNLANGSWTETAAPLPGPSGVLFSVVSAGVSTFWNGAFTTDDDLNPWGTGAGAVALTLQGPSGGRGQYEIYSATNPTSSGSGLPWEPGNGFVYAASIGGEGGSFEGDQKNYSTNLMNGYNGESVSVYLERMDLYSYDTANAGSLLSSSAYTPTVAITAVSRGGQGSVCCMNMPDSDGNWKEGIQHSPNIHDVHDAWNWGGLDHFFWRNKDDLEHGATSFGYNGDASSVYVTLTDSNIYGPNWNSVDAHFIGITAASVGGATKFYYPENFEPRSGAYSYTYIGDIGYHTDDVFPFQVGNDYQAPDGNLWYLTQPGVGKIPVAGSSGDVTVKLTNSIIKNTGGNAVGVYAVSTAEPLGLPFNFNGFTTQNDKTYGGSGKVTVTIDDSSSITLKGTSFTGQINIGVLAASTRTPVLPFTSDLVFYNEYPNSVGYGTTDVVTVTNYGSITTYGRQSVGVSAFSSTGGALQPSGTAYASNGYSALSLFKDDVATVSDEALVNVNNYGTITATGQSVIGIHAAAGSSVSLIHSVTGSDDVVLGNNDTNSASQNYYYAQRVLCTDYEDRGPCPDDGHFIALKIDSLDYADSSPGGNVDVYSNGTIQVGYFTNGTSPTLAAYGILAQSIGSAGGVVKGGAASQIGDVGGGGDAGWLKVTHHGTIIAYGSDSATGVLAQSIGGGGGAGANVDKAFAAIGGSGGKGGNGGSIVLTIGEGALVYTYGDYSAGYIAHSIGGGGGHGGSSKSFGLFGDVSIGGTGGSGGAGGAIRFSYEDSNPHTVVTNGQHSHGILLQSIGGGGGVGGSANATSAGLMSFSVALGGSGGSGGAGGDIFGGNKVDCAPFTCGPATPVISKVVTQAHNSTAIMFQSIGGGGGAGGSAVAKSYDIGLAPDIPAVGVAIALGGNGGDGGAGGEIVFLHEGVLSTTGNHSHGLHAQSIGGGGGSGGDGTASSQTVGASKTQINISFGLGGKGGTAGDAESIWLMQGTQTNGSSSTIYTTGHDSIGMYAQSIGGGGGDAGTGSGFNLSAQVAPPGAGEASAASEAEDAANDAENDATTVEKDAKDLVADAGDAGADAGDTGTRSDLTKVGTTIFASATSCLQTIASGTSGSDLTASGVYSCESALVPNPGEPKAKSASVDIAVGRSGGAAGVGGHITLHQNGLIVTAGSGSHGAFAQSIGGGGGKASAAGADASGGKLAVTVNVGGAGGNGATGGDVWVTNAGSIVTGRLYDLDNPMQTDRTKFTSPAVVGGDSNGIYAQSIGGGGGHGGNADPNSSAASSAIVDFQNGHLDSISLKALGLNFKKGDISAIEDGLAVVKWGLNGLSPKDFSYSPTVNVGGNGGTGGDGGGVSVENTGLIVTYGHRSFGVLAQSIGGGGGVGGSASGALFAPNASLSSSGVDFSPTLNVGGAGGASGAGGSVTLSSNDETASITTHGYASYGIALQSIGGGGGIAHEGSTLGLSDASGVTSTSTGSISFGRISMSNGQYESTNTNQLQEYASLNYSDVAAGNSGDGGNVSVGTVDSPAKGSVTTHGDDAMGIFLQSIGGGGGIATLGCTNSTPSSTSHMASACWGNTNVSGSGGQPAEFIGLGGTSVDIFVNHNTAGSNSSSGEINVYSEQTITTYGARSMGVVAQSISAGGGFFSGPNSKIGLALLPESQAASGSPGAITVSLNTSTITTSGDGAWGLFTQTVQGGGGFLGDSSQDLQFTVPSYFNFDIFWGGDAFGGTTTRRPTSVTDVQFAQMQVADVHEWDYSGCMDTSACVINEMVAGEPYKIPYQDGRVQWNDGDYLQFAASGDSSNPYEVRQYQSDGKLKGSIGKGRIVTIEDGVFFFVGDDGLTAQLYRGDGLITDTEIVINGTHNPSPADVDKVVKSSFFSVPLNIDGSGDVESSEFKVVKASDFASASNTTAATASTTVELTNSNIETHGTNAHGIVINNQGGAGGWAGGFGPSAGAGSNGGVSSGKVDLTLDQSTVKVLGPKSRGVVIFTAGGSMDADLDADYAYGVEPITVSLSNNSSIHSLQNTALLLVGGSYSSTPADQNTITIDDTSSIINGLYETYAGAALDNTESTYNKWAVYAPTGYTNLNNSGTIRGNVLLGIATKGDFVNNGDWHGSTAIVANNSLHNYGTIYAGGEGATGGLFIDGSLKHYEGGEIHVDLHPLGDGESHDAITVTGLARMQGEIVPQTKSLLPGDYQFLTAGTLEHSGSVRDAHVFSWDATVDGNTLTKTPTANFAPAGFSLTGNQASLAGYLQRGWDSGEREKGYLFGYLHEHDQGAHGDYQATLDQLMGQTLNAQPIQFQTAFSTYMSESLSCPTVTEQGLRLNQDNCAWAKVTGDISDQSANSSNPGFRATGGGIRLGAQKSLGNGWSAGFGAGYALNYLTSTNFSSNGQFLDLSVSAKKQIEQWEFGGSLGYAQGWFENNRYRAMGANGAADAMDGVFASDSRMSIMGLRLRAAYVHELDKDHYLKPYVDVDLSYSSMPGYSETGTAPLALNVGSSSRWNVAITPMLEYGLDVITEDKSRVKLFASAGASFLPNNSHKSETSFAGVSAALGTFDVVTDGPEILGRLNLGIQAFHSDDLEVRAQYGLLAGDGYWSQSLSANLVWRF